METIEAGYMLGQEKVAREFQLKKDWKRPAAGWLAGGTAGTLLGQAAGTAAGLGPKRSMATATLGAMAGGAGGAYLGYRSKKKALAKQEEQAKEGSDMELIEVGYVYGHEKIALSLSDVKGMAPRAALYGAGGAAVGAGIGALSGGGKHLPPEERGKSRLKRALIGGAIGGVAGAGLGAAKSYQAGAKAMRTKGLAAQGKQMGTNIGRAQAQAMGQTAMRQKGLSGLKEGIKGQMKRHKIGESWKRKQKVKDVFGSLKQKATDFGKSVSESMSKDRPTPTRFAYGGR